MFTGGGGFQLGAGAANPATSTAPSQPTLGLNVAGTGAPLFGGVSLGGTPAANPVTSTVPSQPAAPIFSFGTGSVASAPVTAGSTLPISTPIAAPGAPAATLGLSTAPPAGAALNTATTTTSSGAVSSPQMNFRQLQELVNKWTVELDEQEKVFIEQATKVNTWDRTLMANGDKIAKLSDSVEKVKTDHVRLEHTLDYLKSQQQEFEGYLDILEGSLPANPTTEPEREYMHNLAENMDTQLQQMAEDLKDVIRHINDTNKPLEKADPVSQILKILNEHTDALQWVEDNTTAVKKSLDDITSAQQNFRRDHERSLRLMSKN